jgi:hypothetical protein
LFNLISSTRGPVSGAAELLLEDLPFECVQQVGATGGDRTADALLWQRKLSFTVNLECAKRHLIATGGWTMAQVRAQTAEETAAIILWIVCGEFYEYRRNPARGGNAFRLSM